MRLFTVERDEDLSGISGTGRVAELVEFGDGTVAMRWLGELASTAIYDTLAHALEIHGHGGKTRFVELAAGGPTLQRRKATT